MAIRTVVTRGYGNGTFNGTIGLVVGRGYAPGAAVEPETPAVAVVTTSGGGAGGGRTLHAPIVRPAPVRTGRGRTRAFLPRVSARGTVTPVVSGTAAIRQFQHEGRVSVSALRAELLAHSEHEDPYALARMEDAALLAMWLGGKDEDS